MEIDAGLWMLLACIIGFIYCGCVMTAPKMALRDLNSGKPAAQRH
jgi:hypothetical protein